MVLQLDPIEGFSIWKTIESSDQKPFTTNEKGGKYLKWKVLLESKVYRVFGDPNENEGDIIGFLRTCFNRGF